MTRSVLHLLGNELLWAHTHILQKHAMFSKYFYCSQKEFLMETFSFIVKVTCTPSPLLQMQMWMFHEEYKLQGSARWLEMHKILAVLKSRGIWRTKAAGKDGVLEVRPSGLDHSTT